ncbi:hypothetical protein SNEBB_008857 [Seison nebaliae]|nr:hypothetical protein SNEBB_008857 [Seison nebaliae]
MYWEIITKLNKRLKSKLRWGIRNTVIRLKIIICSEDVGAYQSTRKAFFPNKLPQVTRGSQTFKEYLHSNDDRMFDQKILKDSFWMHSTRTEIIKQNNFPKNLHHEVISKMKLIIASIITTVTSNRTITLDDLDKTYKPIPLEEFPLKSYQQGLHDKYWNENRFVTQNLIEHFAYKITNVGELLNLTADPQISKLYHNNIMDLYDSFGAIKQVKGNELLKSLIRDKVKSIIVDALYYEMIATIEQFKINRTYFNKGFYKQTMKINPISISMRHVKDVVKSFNDRYRWYLVDNCVVIEIIDIRTFFSGGYTFSFISEMFRYEEESYNLKNNLKKYIQPILCIDYGKKLRLESTPISKNQ